MKRTSTQTFPKPQKATATNILLIATIVSQHQQAKPFHHEKENNSYAHLSQRCSNVGLRLYITHFANSLSNSSIFSWTYEEGNWVLGAHSLAEIDIAYADLPPNFESANVLRKMLLCHNIRIINDLALSDCLTDKVATYHLLPEFVPPTFDMDDPKLIQKLSVLPNHQDLIKEQLLLKPRYGERGKGIEIINFFDLSSRQLAGYKNYIAQPLIETNCGIPSLDIQGRHDLRMLIQNGTIVQFYVRVPKAQSYISNKSHGGQFFYYELEALPQQFRELANIVDQRLMQYSPRLYSIDIGVGKSGKIWIFELNTMPGIVWEEKYELDKRKNMELHEILVDAFRTLSLESAYV